MIHNKNINKSFKTNLFLLLEQTESVSKTGSWELDLIQNTVIWSDGFYKILDFEPQSFEVTFDKALEIIHPDDRVRAIKILDSAINEKKEYRIQKRIISSKGIIKHVVSSAKVLNDENGNPIKLIGVIHDISEFIKTNEELENLKAIVNDITNSIDGIVWESDLKTFKFTYISDQVEKILGYSAEEWLSEENFWINHIHPEDQVMAVKYCHDEILKGNYHTFNYRMLHKNGHYIWLQDRVSVIKQNNIPTYLRGLLVNIQKDKEYLDKIEEEKKLSQTLIKFLPNAVFIFDQDGKMLLWNDKFLELSEYLDEEVVHLSPFHFFDSSRSELLIKQLEIIERFGYTEVETEFTSKSGKRKPIFLMARKLNYDGKICIYGVGVDISQRNELLTEQRKLLNTIETIIHSTPESLLVFNKEFDLLKENSSFEKLVTNYASKLNYTNEELRIEIMKQLTRAILDNKKPRIVVDRKINN